MPMSKDRVRFTLTYKMTRCEGYQTLVENAFGISASYVKEYGDAYKPLTLVCCPDQFARFLIVRNNRKLPGSFEELEPYLFRPPLPEVVDVSCDPDQHNEDS